MKRSLDIPDQLYERLKEKAEQKGITVASLIKLACSEWLEKQDK